MNPKLCPTCSTPIPAAAPGGFCPACLLRDAAEPATTGQSAPSLEEVAAAFPSLEILSLIGQGGMGSVYKVRQPNLDRIVALKLLAPALSRDPAFAERFAREARVLGKLNHPNIVAVYEHGRSDGRDLKDGSDTSDGGFYYLIMEYVDGVNLRQAMRAGRFTPEQALAIVPGICDALQAAHAQGIWHRDIKPENILLDQRGGVKIADFGIARLVGDQTRNFTLTGTGNALGSIAYMAPEQHESPHTVDHRADIYSLGVVIYEMLTGELPLGRFPAPSQRAAVSARIDEIVFQTLEKERELRQQSATEVKTDVQSVREINRDPLPMPAAKSEWTARSTAKAAMLGGLVLFVSATIFTRGSTQSLLLALSAVPIVLGFFGWIFLPKPALTVEGVLREMNRLANEYLTEKFREFIATGSPLAAPESFQFGRQLLEGTLIHFHRGQARPPDFMNRPQVSLVADLLRSNGDRESVECLFRAEAEGWRLVDCQVGALKGDDRIPIRSAGESKGSQKATAGRQPPSLTPTIIIHFALFALLCAIFFLVVPRFNAIFKEMGEPLSNYVRVAFPSPILSLLLFLALFGLDIFLCFLARKEGGRKALRRWSLAVVALLITAFVLTAVALWLPMKSLISSMENATTAPSRMLGRIKCAVLKTEATGQGIPSFILDVAEGKPLHWTPNTGQSVQMKDGKTLWFKAGVNSQSVPPVASVAVSTDGTTWETHSQTMELRNNPDARTLAFQNGLQIGLSWSPEGSGVMLSSGSVATSPAPFLEWAQGEWVMDREESQRATAALYPNGLNHSLGAAALRDSSKPFATVFHVRFSNRIFEFWAPGVAGSSGRTPLPTPGKDASPDQITFTAKKEFFSDTSSTPYKVEEAPLVFSKSKDGLLHWIGENPEGGKLVMVFRRYDANKDGATKAADEESWSYTLRHIDAGKLGEKMKANPVANVTTKVQAGVVTLTGPRDPVRQLATMLRVLDQPEVNNPLELPLLNMPPDFFTRLAIPGLMSGTEFKDTQFEPEFFETLERENITAPQLARALAGHVLELEKATFVNTGTPIESIMKTPGASTYYDGTIPCADQPDKPLTFRIRRTTQTMGTKPDIAGLAPWLLEEAKLQSKEPIVGPMKSTEKSGPSKESDIPQPDAKPAAEAPAQPASNVRLNVEGKTSSTEGTQRSENRTISMQAEKPGYVHLWMPGGKRFTEKLNDNSQVAQIAFHSTTGFYSRVSYSLYEKDGPVLEYNIAQPAQLVELAKQSLSYDDVAKGLREVRDPTGICLRNTIYDLAPIGDSALLLAVTDTAEPPPETQYFLHIWQPPLQHTVPPQSGTPFERIPVRIGEMLVTPGEPGKNVGNKLTGQRVGRISQRDGKYHADLHYSAGSTAMLNQPMTPEVPIAVSVHMISAGGIWPQFMLLSTKPDVTPFLNEEYFKPATAKEKQQGTTLAQQAEHLAATKGKVWKSGVLDLCRENGVQFQQILMLEFAPFAGQRENPPQASVKVLSASPTVKEGPITLSVGIGTDDFSDVRLEEKDGNRTIRITRAIETVDQPIEKTEHILNQLSFSCAYLLTTDTLTLKAGTIKVEGFPTGEINWGSIGFVTPTRDIVFKLAP